MSNATLNKVRSEALELPHSDRAALARDLLSSLDGPPDRDVDQAWGKEIERRLDEVESGRTHTIDAEESIRRIRERLAAKK